MSKCVTTTEGVAWVTAAEAQRKQSVSLPKRLDEEDLSLLLNREGRLFSKGHSPYGWSMACQTMNRIGHQPLKTEKPQFDIIPALKDEAIRDIATDGEQCAVFAIGQYVLWSWGTQQNGLLGNGSTHPVCYEPRAILDLRHEALKSSKDGPAEEWVQVSGGMRHGAALSSAGRLFTWGMSNWGAGHADIGEQLEPAVPAALQDKRIVYVHCTTNEYADSTLAVDDQGTVLRPKYDPLTSQCPWVPQPLSIDTARALALHPSIVSLTLAKQ